MENQISTVLNFSQKHFCVDNSIWYGNIVTIRSSYKHSKQMLYIADVRVELLFV